MDWLSDLLANGEVDAARVKAEATAAGLAWRTVQRAADELDVIREKNSYTGGWQWRFPKPGNEGDKIVVPSSSISNNLASCHLGEISSKTQVLEGLAAQDAKLKKPETLSAHGDESDAEFDRQEREGVQDDPRLTYRKFGCAKCKYSTAPSSFPPAHTACPMCGGDWLEQCPSAGAMTCQLP
jgi:hypothetical protein